MDYSHPSEIMDEIARLTPTFNGVSYAALDRHGSLQWPCNAAAPDGTVTMHIGEFVRGKGRFMITRYVPTEERQRPLPAAAHHRAHPQPVQCRRANPPHRQRGLARGRPAGNPPADAENRGIVDGDWVGVASRAGETVLRAKVSERVAAGVVYTTFHFPESGANVITTDNSDWATNCPEYKVTAVEIIKVNQPSEWQQRYRHFSRQQQELLRQGRGEEVQ
jgi:formate dehydrogenase major subunit